MNPRTVEKTGDASGEEETALVLQEFVANPNYTVEEILSLAGLRIRSFYRFECGEQMS